LGLKFDAARLRMEIRKTRRGLRDKFAGRNEQLLTYWAMFGVVLFRVVIAHQVQI
jgi:hypothetical protein